MRKRSIYEAVVYDAQVSRQGALRLPAGPRAHRRRSVADGPEPRRAALRPQRSARARRQPAGQRSTASRFGCSPAAGAAAAAASSRGSTRPAWRGKPLVGRLRLRLPRQRRRSALRRRRATRAGRCARPGRARASAATSCRASARSAPRASTRPTGSAISRSGARWSAPAMPARRCSPRRRRRSSSAGDQRADGADQPDPAGRPLFAGQPRDQIRLPVHRLHLPRAADVRRDRRRARVGGRISADGRGAGAVLRAAARLRRSDRLHARLHPRLGGDRRAEHRLFRRGARELAPGRASSAGCSSASMPCSTSSSASRPSRC